MGGRVLEIDAAEFPGGCSGVVGDITSWSALTLITTVDLGGCTEVSGDVTSWSGAKDPVLGQWHSHRKWSLQLERGALYLRRCL
jgi:hypothetical protein